MPSHAITHSKQLAQLLRARRRGLKVAQKQLAGKLGISQSRLSEIESNPAALSVERLLDIANVLGLEIVIRDRQQQAPASAEW